MSKSEKTQAVTNILIGCTGSVASIKLIDLIHHLQGFSNRVAVRVVVTEPAVHFIDIAAVQETGVEIFRDADEWQAWSKRGDPVLHIELRRWADLMVIAPLDANTLAKLANGLCDNLLTCVVRAWDLKRPLLFAPAMNTLMYEHPITAQHIATLQKFGYTEIPTIEKQLMCNDKGKGAMAEVATIVEKIKDTIEKLN